MLKLPGLLNTSSSTRVTFVESSPLAAATIRAVQPPAVVRFGFATGAEVDRSDPAYQMYQRYVFNANATMGYTASDGPPTPDEHRALLLRPAAATWALDERGWLVRQDPGAPRVARSECRVVTQRLKDPRSAVPAPPVTCC